MFQYVIPCRTLGITISKMVLLYSKKLSIRLVEPPDFEAVEKRAETELVNLLN